jgi:hypothetical protein
MASGERWLFHDVHNASVGIELDNTVALRVLDGIAEDRPAGVVAERRAQEVQLAVEEVVPEDEAHLALPDELRAVDEGFRNPLRFGLDGVREGDAPLATITEQLLEAWKVPRRGDEQDIANAHQHERCQRVVDHGLVVDRLELLADDGGHRVQPCSAAAGEDDAAGLHCVPMPVVFRGKDTEAQSWRAAHVLWRRCSAVGW